MKYFIHFDKKEAELNSLITQLCLEHLHDFPISNELEIGDPSKIQEMPFEQVLTLLNLSLSQFIYFDSSYYNKILSNMDQKTFESITGIENSIVSINQAQELYRNTLTTKHETASSLVRMILSSLNKKSQILNQQLEAVFADISGYFLLLNAILSLNIAIVRLSNAEIKLILAMTKIWREKFEESFLPRISNEEIKSLFEKFKQNYQEFIKSMDTPFVIVQNSFNQSQSARVERKHSGKLQTEDDQKKTSNEVEVPTLGNSVTVIAPARSTKERFKPLPALNASGQFPFDWQACLIEAFDAVVIDDSGDSNQKHKHCI
jgi:hypothetical protein